MAASDNLSSWEVIQQGVREAERLIGQKQYNLSMVKARQTLEYMVNLLAEKACIVDGDLIDVIDSLYQGRWISKSTCEHYHKIRMIGNKAVHEGSDNAYDANQAHHILSQEVYVFANEYSSRRRSSAGNRTSGSAGTSGTARSSGSGSRTSGSGSRSSGSSSRTSGSGSRTSGSRTSGSGSGSRTSGSGSRTSGSRSSGSSRSSSRPQSSAGTRSRRRSSKKSRGINSYDLLKLLIPVLCIILLIALIRFIRPGGNKDAETTTAPSTTAVEQPVTETNPLPPETMPPETQTPAAVYKTTKRVNVRTQPGTDQDIITTLDSDTVIDVIRTHDEKWMVIMYEGQEAYISSDFVTTE